MPGSNLGSFLVIYVQDKQPYRCAIAPASHVGFLASCLLFSDLGLVLQMLHLPSTLVFIGQWRFCWSEKEGTFVFQSPPWELVYVFHLLREKQKVAWLDTIDLVCLLTVTGNFGSVGQHWGAPGSVGHRCQKGKGRPPDQQFPNSARTRFRKQRLRNAERKYFTGCSGNWWLITVELIHAAHAEWTVIYHWSVLSGLVFGGTR